MATYELAVMPDDVVEPLQVSSARASYLVVRTDITPYQVFARFPNQTLAQRTVDALNLQGL